MERRIITLLSLLALILPGSAAAQARPTPPEVVSLEPYAFPPFDPEAVPSGHAYTEAEYDRVRRSEAFELLKLTYRSDDLPVVAHLYKPTETRGAKLPVLIFARGGYVTEDSGPRLAPFYHGFAEAGFLVIAPQLRGSSGAPGHDELGGADVRDVLALLPVLRSVGYADTARLFMVGESRGGMMAYRAIQEGLPLRAAAVYGAFTDLGRLLAAMAEENPEVEAMTGRIWPDFAERRDEILRARSALAWAEDLDVPLLIMHGGRDGDVSPTHSLDLARRLTELGHTYELVVFAEDRHTLPSNQDERDERIIRWFMRFDEGHRPPSADRSEG